MRETPDARNLTDIQEVVAAEGPSSGGSPREGARSEERAEQRLAAGGRRLPRPGRVAGYKLTRPGRVAGYKLTRPGRVAGYKLTRPGCARARPGRVTARTLTC